MSGAPMSAATEAGAPATELKKIIPKTKEEFYVSITKMMTEAKSASAKDDPIDYLPCIYKVPDRVRELKPSAYTPRMVSIGPLHRGDQVLKGMQEHKVRYMNRLLDRMAKSEETPQRVADQTMRQCADAMLTCVPRARGCYAEKTERRYSNFQFAEMMLVDGCFVLEFLFHWVALDRRRDPIYDNPLVRDTVERDLLLLENQIPFFVLQDLFKLTLQLIINRPQYEHTFSIVKKLSHLNYGEEFSLIQLVLAYYGNIMNQESEITINGDKTTKTTDYYHILGLLHKCYEPVGLEDLMDSDMFLAKRSATEIHRAGVHMEANTEGKYNLQVDFQTSCCLKTILSKIVPSSWLWCTCFLDNNTTSKEDEEPNPAQKTSSSWMCGLSQLCSSCMSELSQFCGRTCLKLPKLVLTDVTEPFLRNLIAYEQCCPWTLGYITSYATLMDTLVDSKEDVELLQEARVLENHLGASEDATVLFNNLCKEVLSGDIYFYKAWKDLDNYCSRSWPKNIASLRSTYFSNPWSLVSLIAALILFGLTILQTVYTIRSA